MEKITFVGDFLYNAGSGQAVMEYSKAARRNDIPVSVAGLVDSVIAKKVPVIESVSEKNTDRVVFVFENLMYLDPIRYPGRLDHYLKNTKRENRIVIDTDGKYGRYKQNDMSVSDDERAWDSTINELSDILLQPCIRPISGNVTPFLFYGFPNTIDGRLLSKRFDITYVGNNWFREREMTDFLRAALDSGAINRVQIKGKNWDKDRLYSEIFDQKDTASTSSSTLNLRVAKFGVSENLLHTMSSGRINPILVYNTLLLRGLVTPRMFETFAADTFPLFYDNFDYNYELYGDGASRFSSSKQDMKDKIRDVVDQPQTYILSRDDIRRNLLSNHSYEKRLIQLKRLMSTS